MAESAAEALSPPSNEPHATPALPKAKKKGNVRFMTTSEGDVVPERVRFERSSSSSRSKAQEALDCLLAGNQRFRQGNLVRCKAGPEVLEEVAGEIPKPSTVILACSDSRVPPELICDQGLGDCHVVRVAGNVVNDFVLGSILFAVQHLGCRLVLVMGHSRCSVVASAVQTWARDKSLKRDNPTVRTLAEGVQQTLGHGPSTGQLRPPPPAISAIPVSPFQAEATKPSPEAPAEQPRPSLFARLCGGCGGQAHSHAVENDTVSGASTPMQTQGLGVGESKRSPSNERGVARSSIGRSSINPLTALVGAIGGAVEAVANSGQHEGFKTLVHKENRLRDKGYDSDDEQLKKGLAKQDSMEFTRARLAKQREERKIETLRTLAQRADVASVIDENTKVSASTILKGLVKNLDPEIVHDVEVASGKYDIETGCLKVISRSWYSNRTYYNSLE